MALAQKQTVDQYNRTGNPEISPLMQKPPLEKRQPPQQLVLGKLDVHM
jgi:hypothetical protein